MEMPSEVYGTRPESILGQYALSMPSLANYAHPCRLVVDNPAGLFEFSDMTMVGDEHPFLSRIDGYDVSSYLERYAEHHGLDKRIRLNIRVVNVSREGKGWSVVTQTEEKLYCDKLIVSTGLASEPKKPDITNINDGFSGAVMHTCSLGRQHHLLTDPKVKEVVVVGGSKSAIETVCLCIEAGKFVHWVIRPEGGGASMMIVTDKDNPRVIALNATRILNVFSPSIFAASGCWYKFLHRGDSSLGRKVESLYWKTASKVVTRGPKYERSQNGEKVRPITNSVFWNPNCISLIDSKSSFLDYLHDESKLRVRKATVTHLSSAGVHFADGQVLRADAIAYATGWEKSSSFFYMETTLDLGLPVKLSEEPTATTVAWSRLHTAAEKKVKSTLPELTNPPEFNLPKPTKTPYRLYRNVIPANFAAHGDRSIAFTGMLITSQTVIFAELSSLYAVAYMENLIPSPLPSLEQMNEEIALSNAWTASRYGYRGVREPLNLSEQTYFDILCRDLGITSHRKRGSRGFFRLDRWAKEWLEPYRASDYRGLVEEFVRNRGRATPSKLKGEVTYSLDKSGTSIGSNKARTVVKEMEVEPAATIRPICYRMGSSFSSKGN